MAVTWPTQALSVETGGGDDSDTGGGGDVAVVVGRDVVVVSQRAAPIWPKHGQSLGRLTAAVVAMRWWWWWQLMR